MGARRRKRGRPAGGSAQIVRAVLTVTLTQLGEHGYAALSVEAVAQSAGVNKTSVYRRWPTKSALVLAALDGATDGEPAFASSGDLALDLFELLTRKVKRLSTPRGKALARALMTIDGDPALVTIVRARTFGLSASVMQAAISRGELPRDTDPHFASELVLAPIVHRVLLLNERATPAFVEDVIRSVLTGLGYRGKKAAPRQRTGR